MFVGEPTNPKKETELLGDPVKKTSAGAKKKTDLSGSRPRRGHTARCPNASGASAHRPLVLEKDDGDIKEP